MLINVYKCLQMELRLATGPSAWAGPWDLLPWDLAERTRPMVGPGPPVTPFLPTLHQPTKPKTTMHKYLLY